MLGQTTKLGPMSKVMSLMPGMGAMKDMVNDVDAAKDMQQLMGVIDSMTPEEKRNPKGMIDHGRRRRIAAGAGVEPHQVNELVKQFEPIAGMMKKMATVGVKDRFKMMKEMTQGMDPSGGIKKQKLKGGKRLSKKEKEKIKRQRAKEFRRKKREKKRGTDG